ncbi:MAG: phosphatase PAP2 family protein [Bacteroidota bacterium]
MIEQLEQIDRDLFLYLNGLHQDWLDPIMVGFSDPLCSLPLYLLVFYFIKNKFGWKIALWSLLATVIVILLCDMISYRVFKQGFQRFRPCHNLEIQDLVYLAKGSCGGKFTFVSGHATNFLGLATFWGFLLKNKVNFIMPVLFIWAIIIAYSRIYLGVHYPADVTCGGILGIFLGYLVFRSFRNILHKRKWAEI